MTITTKSDVFNPEILTDAVQGLFAGKDAFMGSVLASSGAVVVADSMPEGSPEAIGNTITVPFFDIIGEFAANADGSSVTPSKLQQSSEQATISRDSLAFEVSRWARGLGSISNRTVDPYLEAARQILVAATRAMDTRCITAAAATPLIHSVYHATVPVFISYDAVIDALGKWGDDIGDAAVMVVHSQIRKDMLKLKDSTGRPLVVHDVGERAVERFAGIPIRVSDRTPLTGSSMGAVTESGTTPPDITLSGTPLGAWDLVIECVVGGARGTSTFRFSTDGGNTWSATMTTAASVPLIDTAVDSLVGMNGKTGITAAMESASSNADNSYTAKALLKCHSLIAAPGALAFWYNRGALALKTDSDILADTDIGAMHLYGTAHLYRRRPGSRRPGVIDLATNASGFLGA